MLKRFFSPPKFDDEEKTRTAGFINVIILSNIPILLLFMVARISTGASPFGLPNFILLTIVTVLTIAWFLMKGGFVRTSGYLHIITIWIASTLIALTGSGIRGTAFMSYFVVMLMAGLLLGWKPAISFTVLSIISAFGLTYAENRGIIVYSPGPAINNAIEGTVLFTFGAIFLYLIITSFQSAVKKASVTTSELRDSNQQLIELRDVLELRVEERTAELEQTAQQLQKRAGQFEAIAQLARTISSVQDLSTLLPRITQLVSQHFGFYHVGLFLLDDSRKYAVLSAANSEGGQRMLTRGHRLGVGQTGIVGFVTATGNHRIALDTVTDTVYFDNPDLPETRSEMALPIRVGGSIIGALDVQSTESNAFSEDDVEVLSILADEVGVAIDNARLYAESQRILAEAQKVFQEYTAESWRNMVAKRKIIGYELSGVFIRPLEKPAKGTGSTISVPIKLRNQVIGSMNINLPAGNEWTPDEMEIAQALAERVGIASESAMLLEDSQRRAAKEHTIGQVSEKFIATTDISEILKTAVKEISQIISGADVALQLEETVD